MVREYLDFAIACARAGGEILRAKRGTNFRVEKKAEIDLVTEVDREVENLIISRIQKTYPDHRILAEESGAQGIGDKPLWIIDPLDGTTNFAHNYPCFCVSIGLEIKKELEVGVIYDPLRDELFTAQAGNGAFLNGERIHVSKTQKVIDSLLVTGFAYDIRDSRSKNLDEFNTFILKAQGVRRDGSAALDLAYLACGRFDGFWEYNLKPWDVAAGVLLVREAGGKITAVDGADFDLHGRNLLASNGTLHTEMAAILEAAQSAL